MYRDVAFPSHVRFGLAGLLTAISLAAAPLGLSAAEPQMRGIWMHATQAKNRAEADACVARIDRANLNAVFVLVWYWGGQASFRSDLCPMAEGVEEGFDPLGRLIEQCHQRGIEVHAWFVNGAYGSSKVRHVLDEHPDWAVDAGAAGELWYDFGKPEVRRFQSDLMIECLSKYDLDGIHFDYIRYGPKSCWCRHCQEEFARRYGFEPLTSEARNSFPVVAPVSSNPVVEPTTAKVLARFSDGTPAIAINELDRGKVVFFNWHAEQEMPPPAAETLKRALASWAAAKGKVFVMDTEPNRQRYGGRMTAAGAETLKNLGYPAKVIREDGLGKLTADATLVLSAVYLIPDDVVEEIERFVSAGGRLVVFDGPVFAIKNAAMQRVLGMARSGRYFHGTEVITALGNSDLVPTSDRKVTVEDQQRRQAKWAEFRAWGVSELVRDVYRRAKKLKPEAQVTAAVFTPLASAEAVYQDWPGWLREGTIDYVIPMAYTMDTQALGKQIDEWKTVDAKLARIIPGLSVYERTPDGAKTRDVDLILRQRRLCLEKGAHGNLFFALPYLNPPLRDALRDGPFKTETPAYRPPPRRESTD